MPNHACPCGCPVRPRHSFCSACDRTRRWARRMAQHGGVRLRSLERWAEAVARDRRRSWRCACGANVEVRCTEHQRCSECAALRTWARHLTHGSGRRIRSLERWAERIARRGPPPRTGGRTGPPAAAAAPGAARAAPISRIRSTACTAPAAPGSATGRAGGRSSPAWKRSGGSAASPETGSAARAETSRARPSTRAAPGADATSRPASRTRRAATRCTSPPRTSTCPPAAPWSGTARTERRSSRTVRRTRAWPGSPNPRQATACAPRCGASRRTRRHTPRPASMRYPPFADQ